MVDHFERPDVDPLALLLIATRRRREGLGVKADHPEIIRHDCAAAAVALLAGLAVEAARIGEARRLIGRSSWPCEFWL